MTAVQFPPDLVGRFVAPPFCVCCGEPSTKMRVEHVFRDGRNQEIPFPYCDRCYDHDLIDEKTAVFGCAAGLLIALFIGLPLAAGDDHRFIGLLILLVSLGVGVWMAYTAISRAAGAKARALKPNCKATAHAPAVKVKASLNRPFEIEFRNDAVGHVWATLVLLWSLMGLNPLRQAAERVAMVTELSRLQRELEELKRKAGA